MSRAARISLAVLALLIASGAAGPARATEAGTEQARRSHAIASQVMSPYCPGRTLADCPSPSAAALRAEIRKLVEDGVDDGAIRAQLESRFGDAILGVPRGIVGWTLPGVLLLAGAGILVRVLRRLSRRGAGAAGTAPLDPEVEQELDRKLGL